MQWIGPGWLFLALTGAVCVTAWWVLLQPVRPDVLALAVTLDLTLFIPLLYWLLLVRPNDWPAFSVLPVFLATLILASVIVPQDRQAALHIIDYLAIPVELVLVGLLVRRARLAVRAGRSDPGSDIHERIRAATYELVRHRRAADVIAYEVSVLWYAFLSWRSADEHGAGDAAFTHHRKAAYGPVVVVILIAIAVEIIPIHALLGRWSITAAWVVTGLSLYSAIWLIGDYRAIRLEVTMLDADHLHVRFGIRWRLALPLAGIESVERIGGRVTREAADLRVALPGSRRLMIRLSSPVEAIGPWGLRRKVRVLELGLDDPERLEALILDRMDSRHPGRQSRP